MRTVSLAVLLPLLLGACFTYVPAPESRPLGQGARVRVHLTEPRDVRLTNVTGNDVVLVTGELARARPDSLAVSVYFMQARSGYEFLGSGETLVLPHSQVASVEYRRLAPGRSALVAGAVAAGTALLAVTVRGGGAEGGNRGNGGQGQ